jgi:hypothetical protein
MALPDDPVAWPAAMDPAEVLDFVMDMAGVLDDGEGIAAFTLAMSAEGAATGLAIQTGAGRDPLRIEDDRAIRLWLGVAAPVQSHPAFAGDGTRFGIEVRIVTDSNPPRTRERTFALTVRQR